MEAELAEVRAARRRVNAGGAAGGARAGRGVTFLSPDQLRREESRLVLQLNRLRELPEAWEFKEVET